jgi:hypothetical protein
MCIVLSSDQSAVIFLNIISKGHDLHRARSVASKVATAFVNNEY